MKKHIVLLCVCAFFVPFSSLLIGCDMVHAVRIASKNNNVIDGSHRTQTSNTMNLMSALAPVIEKYDLNCQSKADGDKMSSQMICKTWALSYSRVRILNDNTSAAVVFVEDISPIFLWEPQPYDRIKTDVIKTFEKELKAGRLDCRQGFGFRAPCEKKNAAPGL